MFVSLTVGGDGESQDKTPVDEPNYSPVQHSAVMTDDDVDFGLSLKASDVTRTSLTLTCEQSGGSFTGELSTGPQFSLDRLDGAKWIICDTLVPEEELAWTMELYLIQPDGSVTWDVDWSNIYGEVPAGNYRISKTFMDETSENTYFAYFTVE